MADMILLEHQFLNSGTAVIGPPMTMVSGQSRPGIYINDGVGAGIGIANLSTDDPREVWQSGAGALVVNIWIDLGQDVEWDTIAIFNTNITATATWRIFDGNQASANYSLNPDINGGGGSGTLARVASEDINSASGVCLFVGAVRTARYILVAITLPSAASVTIGKICIGKSFKPSLPRELGSGRPSLDSGSATRLDSGGLAVVPGSLISGFKWTFADLNSNDLAKLWGIYRRRRTTGPIILIEDPGTPVAEGCHYGRFVALDAYERSDVTKSRWAMQVEDWA